MKTMLSAVLVAMGLTIGTSAFAETTRPEIAPPAPARVNVERREERQDFARARAEQQRAEAKLAEAKRHEAAAARDLARARRDEQRGNAARAGREQQMARRQMAEAGKDMNAAERDERRARELRSEGRQEGREVRQTERRHQG